MTMRTLFVLLDKEFRQFFRNPFLPRMVILFPVMVMLVMPWVTTMDIRHIGVAVVDLDRSEASRRIVQTLRASEYFTLDGLSESYAASLDDLEAGRVDAILDVPDVFGQSLVRDTPARLRIPANCVHPPQASRGTQHSVHRVSSAAPPCRALPRHYL